MAGEVFEEERKSGLTFALRFDSERQRYHRLRLFRKGKEDSLEIEKVDLELSASFQNSVFSPYQRPLQI
jgi:hypothetical protein